MKRFSESWIHRVTSTHWPESLATLLLIVFWTGTPAHLRSNGTLAPLLGAGRSRGAVDAAHQRPVHAGADRLRAVRALRRMWPGSALRSRWMTVSEALRTKESKTASNPKQLRKEPLRGGTRWS